jgi:hypothetical protein
VGTEISESTGKEALAIKRYQANNY